MTELLNFVNEYGLGVVLAIFMAWTLQYFFRWITGRLSTQIDANHQQVLSHIKTQYEKIEDLTKSVDKMGDEISKIDGRLSR